MWDKLEDYLTDLPKTNKRQEVTAKSLNEYVEVLEDIIGGLIASGITHNEIKVITTRSGKLALIVVNNKIKYRVELRLAVEP